MPNQVHVLDDVFRALSNRTRRDVVAQLSNGPASMSELATPHNMALPSFLQHLQVLEASGMVRSKKEGRIRTFELEAAPLIEVEHWIEKHRKQWETRLDQLDAYLNTFRESKS